MRPMPRYVSLAVLLLLIVILGVTFFKVLAPFMLPLFLAGMTAVICQPVFRYFLKRTGDRIQLASLITTSCIMFAITIPLIVGTLVASLQLYTFAHNVVENPEWQQRFKVAKEKAGIQSDSIFEKAVAFGNQFLPKDQQRDPEKVSAEFKEKIRASMNGLGDRSLGRAAGTTIGILAGTAGWLFASGIGLAIYGVALFYFLADSTALIAAAEKLIPVHAEYQRELLIEFGKVVRGVVLATFLAAIGQGIATTLALWFFGFDHLFVLLVLATLAALIPMAGTWLVWFPCMIILFMAGHPYQAALLGIYGAGFVGFLDNVIRTYVLNTDVKLHPLLALISVLGGLQVMGLWGVFIGPIVASVLHALVKIFNHELMELSRERMLRSQPTPQLAGDVVFSDEKTVPPASSAIDLPKQNHPQPTKQSRRKKK